MTGQHLAFDPTVDPAARARRTSEKFVKYPPDMLPAFIAEMDFTVAPPIRNALVAAIENSDLGYTYEGTAFAESVARFVQRRFATDVDPANVMVIPDVMAGIGESLRVLTDPSDAVVINSPVYPPFRGTVREVLRSVVNIPLLRDEHDNYDLDLVGIERAFADGAKAFLLCNPHNPVGRVWPRETLIRIAEVANAHGVLLLVDEIHAPLVLEGAQHASFLALEPDLRRNAIVYTSASKAFNLAGLKCAALVAGSSEMRRRLKALPVETPYRASILGLLATRVAFDECGVWLDGLCAYLAQCRAELGALLAEHLPEIKYAPPEAGYLAWLDCAALRFGDDPSSAFRERGNVALARGYDFGTAGRGFVRLNFGTSLEQLQEIVQRMHNVVH